MNESWHISDMCVMSSGHSALCQGCLDPFLRNTHRPVCPHCREPVARGAWCRVTQSPVKTPSCALFAHEHILSRGAHICSARGESIGNVATTAQRNAADAPDIGCCSMLQRIAMCCSVLQCIAANPVLRGSVKYSVVSLLKTRRRGEGKENMILRCVSNVYVLQAGQERRRRKNICRIWTWSFFLALALLMCIAVCCSMLQCVAVFCGVLLFMTRCSCLVLVFAHVRCSGLQCAAVCCRVL